MSANGVKNINPEGFHHLFDAARHCLMINEPLTKVEATLAVAARWARGELVMDGDTSVECISDPGRPEKPQLVSSHLLPMRGLGSHKGHAAFMHAIAHIEFNAINLAWDAVYRFRDLPRGFYDDWVRIAEEEARHFVLVRDYLVELGFDYGSFSAHNNLWEMALETDDDVLRRMALVPRVLEARGLDVTPGMIERLKHQGYHKAVSILEVIYREEIGHVESGTRWFRHICQQRGVDGQKLFETLIEDHARHRIRHPINEPARLDAGFSQQEINYLYSLI